MQYVLKDILKIITNRITRVEHNVVVLPHLLTITIEPCVGQFTSLCAIFALLKRKLVGLHIISKVTKVHASSSNECKFRTYWFAILQLKWSTSIDLNKTKSLVEHTLLAYSEEQMTMVYLWDNQLHHPTRIMWNFDNLFTPLRIIEPREDKFSTERRPKALYWPESSYSLS